MYVVTLLFIFFLLLNQTGKSCSLKYEKVTDINNMVEIETLMFSFVR